MQYLGKWLLFCIFTGSMCMTPAASAQEPTDAVTDALCIVNLTPGQRPLYQQHGDIPLTPASVTKLITAETILELLGPDYHFTTEVWASQKPVPIEGSSLQAVEILYMRGMGDPMLVSEEWTRLAQALGHLVVKKHITVDGSFFAPKLGIIQEARVLSPYNAKNGAFATNFNTLAFTVNQGEIEHEAQTPLTPYTRFKLIDKRYRRGWAVVDLARQRNHLLISVAGRVRRMNRKFRIHLGFDRRNGSLYAGHLFRTIFKEQHRRTLGKGVRLGPIPADAVKIATHRSSHNAQDAVQALLQYSNNFLANQLLLIVGAKRFGPPATLEKGLKAAYEILHTRKTDNVLMYEGSGLDPNNRISACSLATFLQESYHSGSRLWQVMPRKERIAYKTGTYTRNQVRTLAGYLLREDGTPGAAFAHLCNGNCDSETHAYFKEEQNLWAHVLFDGPRPALNVSPPVSDSASLALGLGTIKAAARQ